MRLSPPATENNAARAFSFHKEKSPEFEAFEQLTRKIVQVPKTEVDELRQDPPSTEQ